MNTGMKISKRANTFVFILLMASLVSCVSAGTPRLSEESSETIVEGKTTKNEIVSLLGEPDQMLRLDKASLDIYIHRVLTEKPPENMFSEGQYEVLTYSKWNYFAVGPMLFPSQETSKALVLVIDPYGVCVKIFYEEDRRSEYLN